MMTRTFFAFTALLFSSVHAQTERTPAPESVTTLLANEHFLAFPAVLDLGEEVLVSYKSGKSHAADPGASLEVMRLRKSSGEVIATESVAQIPNEIMQMGEWVRFPNGEVANYIDAQRAPDFLRSGLCVVRSQNGGKSFAPVERLGVVDGVEYGYAFDAITSDKTTWMLVMTFANLPGGQLIHKTRSRPGSVDVIRSDDNGKTWHFVRSITKALDDAPINESAFMQYGDGFIVTARSYDNRQWLLQTDATFQIRHKVDLTAENEFITSHIGRPRLFERDGGTYLLGRNWIEKGMMQLALFKFDPETLAITQHVVLDNAEKDKVTDGYYAQPYWSKQDGHSRVHFITYKRSGSEKNASLLSLEFDWETVR